jgi:DMSO reductase anchor subunit
LRAWRAFSQWRTSWLSREGVAAVATLLVGGLLALAALLDLHPLLQMLLALPTLVLALATVWCTGMIYESLPTIRAWSHWLTTEIYLMLAVASGAVLLTVILALFGWMPSAAPLTSAGLLAVAAVLKMVYWYDLDSTPRTLTAEQATGLGAIGKVRPLLDAHTQANFVMREMGYAVARRHAMRLRSLALLFAFAIPIALLLLITQMSALTPLMAALALASLGIGLFLERWLFFAEAQHVVTLYYGAGPA